MNQSPIQDCYPDEIAICYGCGRHNSHGLHIQTYWDGTEGVCRFTPRPYHTAFPGYVYGGVIASLIDCHSMGTAIAAAHQAAGLEPAIDSGITFVTANLNVSYLKPTPMGVELLLRSKVRQLGEKKAIVITSVYADEVECVRGEVVAVRIPSRNLDA